MFDDSLLPHPKTRIVAAILVLASLEEDHRPPAALRAAALSLAFFQPDVGEAGASIDALAPDQQTWRDKVEGDVRDIVIRLPGG